MRECYAEVMSDFVVIVAVQAALLWFVAHRLGMTHEVRAPLLKRAALLGLVFGVAFDLLVGRFAGVFGYVLGWNPVFLALNGMLSYGLWIATIALLRNMPLRSFWKWTAALGAAYEAANYVFPVWQWTFGPVFVEEAVVIALAYTGLALLTALGLVLFGRARFKMLQ